MAISDDHRKLQNQPLALVLAEFRFSSVLNMEKHIPELQEKVRKLYPVFNPASQQTMHVTDGTVNIHSSMQWHFSCRESKNTLIIGDDRLVFVTSDYDRFPGFRDNCVYALKVLKEIVEPSLLTRIGLRYIDHISIDDEGVRIKAVAPHFLPSAELGGLGSSKQHRTETVIVTQQGLLAIRSLYGKHGLAVMPDVDHILPVKLNVQRDPSKDILLLDFDHSWADEDTGVVFDLDDAKTRLGSLHSVTREAFWAATTAYARKELWQ